jgi:tetratricopeptide (TPR) repeat protein
MSPRARSGVFALGLIMLLAMMLLQSDIDPKRNRIQSPLGGKKQTELIFQLPGPYILATFTGMRETVAGLLWVRADEFFHEGNSEALMPLVRLITWLDPHYMDVYKTGAWHMDYNITDSSERSDRRYIPPALALMAEGIRNNPDTYDLYFELGFMHYHLKIKDYKKAAEWLEKATTEPDLNPEKVLTYERFPLVVKRMLAHEYEKLGDIGKAKQQWRKVIAETAKMMKEHPKDSLLRQDMTTSQRNYKMLLWRERRRQWDVKPTIDVNFQAKLVRTKPRVIVVSGTANLIDKAEYLKMNPLVTGADRADALRVRTDALNHSEDHDWANGARVDITLTDLNYTPQSLKEFSWEVPKNVTILVDSVRVRGGKFQLEIDMSRDPQIYAFAGKKYRLTLTIDPREAPDFVQDRIGWHGEGITDKRYLDTKTVPGVRIIRKEWIIDRKDII